MKRSLAITGALALTALVAAPAYAGARPAVATHTVCVEVVVDYGGLSTGRAPSATCVTVPHDASGADVLQARAHKLHVPAPRYRSDGLLCAIDGLPKAPECAQQTDGGGYRYWSYWHKQGDQAWSYSHAGPYDTSVSGDHPGEGWAWVDGGKEATRKPRAVPYAQVCPTTTPTPTPKPHPTRSTHRPGTIGPTSAATTSSGTTGTPSARATRASSRSPQRQRHSTPTPPAPTTSYTPVAIADPPRTRQSHAPVAGILGGVVLVGAIAGGAVWRSRRTG